MADNCQSCYGKGRDKINQLDNLPALRLPSQNIQNFFNVFFAHWLILVVIWFENTIKVRNKLLCPKNPKSVRKLRLLGHLSDKANNSKIFINLNLRKVYYGKIMAEGL